MMFNNQEMIRFHLQKSMLLIALGALHSGIWAQEPRPAPELPVLSACAGETAPFVIISGIATPTGFSVSLYNRVAEQLQQHASFKELPWARCLEEVKAGRIDLAIDAYEDAERRKEFLYTLLYHPHTPGFLSAHGCQPSRSSVLDTCSAAETAWLRCAWLHL